ncbi:MAG: hypothetical protein GY932_04865 [Arcobacter sp.]|nr:hypothetical protein [Arcobacter sp.]
MKKALSLLELIFVLVIITVLVSFSIFKTNSSLEYSNKTKIKSEIALIRNSLLKRKTENILLQKELSFSLDDAKIDHEKSELFKNILDFPLFSSNSSVKSPAKWIKKSQDEYLIYLNNDIFLKFKFEDFSFNCKSDLKLCKEYE